jgi:hypothetical protein
MGLHIGDGQSEPRALQEAPGIAHLDHRRHPGRSAAGDEAIGREEGLAQFGERVAAQRGNGQQAIGRQDGTQPGNVAGD